MGVVFPVLPTPKTNIGKGDIRSFVRMCDTVNRGNYCVKETNLQLQTCYSTCRKDKCNDGDGSLIKGAVEYMYVNINT